MLLIVPSVKDVSLLFMVILYHSVVALSFIK